ASRSARTAEQPQGEEQRQGRAGARTPPGQHAQQPCRRETTPRGEPVRRIAPGRHQRRRDHSC
ncbi:MAG: hypothetical protein IJK55_06635, partial [Bacteroidales bacterium]|nr:hypothetical protein [Bacteroidales bacterium]